MFTGDYGFFDYKYNISGYSGQDFGGPAQEIYLALSAAFLMVLLFSQRGASKDRIRKLAGYTGIFLTLLYLGKTAWETVYDVRLSGSFNTGLLPLDTCSLVMPAALLAGFGKGKARRLAESWLVTGGVVGGVGAMVQLSAFHYYPFFSFGAFYSMLWHWLMVALGLLLAAAGVVPEEDGPFHSPLGSRTVLRGYGFHLLFSLVVIPVDFLFDFDFMMYRYLGGIPLFEDLAAKFTDAGLWFLNPPLMLLLYLLAFQLVWLLLWTSTHLLRRRKPARLPA